MTAAQREATSWDPMSKETANDSRQWDVRYLERNLKRGVVSRKDYDKYLKSLPDAKDKAIRMADADPSFARNGD